MSKLDLGEILANNNPFQNVPNSGTGREQIEYIDIALIDSDPNNFYELSDIDQLAANIELCGLQQPIRVRANPDDSNRVIIVSGHRRRAAIEKLVQEGREDLKEVPCIREQRTGSAALQELQLIYANSDTRKMSNADINRQVERVTALLYQLKEEGLEFPGRMRDHVAEACKISKSKLSRLKVIHDNLIPPLMKVWDQGKMPESVAYALAQHSAELQQKFIELRKLYSYTVKPETWSEFTVKDGMELLREENQLKCQHGTPDGKCENTEKRIEMNVRGNCSWDAACKKGKCCVDCSSLATCRAACKHLSEEIRAAKEARKEQLQKAAEAQAERDKPRVDPITKFWGRFAVARAASGLSIDEYLSAMNIYNDGKVGKRYERFERGEKIKSDTGLPYCGGYGIPLYHVEGLLKASKVLGVSLDYLFCQTDNPNGFVSESGGVQCEPLALGHCQWCPATQFPDDKQELVAIDKDGYATDGTFENGHLRGTGFDWDEVLYWTPMPDPDGVVQVTPRPTGQLMIAGWMPGGTTPAESCEVVAVFKAGGVLVKRISLWNGSSFTFINGTPIEQEPIRWMRLPPDEEAD